MISITVRVDLDAHNLEEAYDLLYRRMGRTGLQWQTYRDSDYLSQWWDHDGEAGDARLLSAAAHSFYSRLARAPEGWSSHGA